MFADIHDHLVNLAHDDLLDPRVPGHLPQDAPVPAPDDEDPLGVGVTHHGQVDDHLLVGHLVTLRQLDHTVQHQDPAVVGGLEHQHVLELRLLLEQDILHLEGESLARPHDILLIEPAILDQRHLDQVINWRKMCLVGLRYYEVHPNSCFTCQCHIVMSTHHD